MSNTPFTVYSRLEAKRMDKLAKARRAVIETPRLRLMACDADLTAAILEDKSRARMLPERRLALRMAGR
jgi:hypothetical protein